MGGLRKYPGYYLAVLIGCWSRVVLMDGMMVRFRSRPHSLVDGDGSDGYVSDLGGIWLGVGVGSWQIWIYGVRTYLWLLVCWYGMGARSVQSL